MSEPRDTQDSNGAKTNHEGSGRKQLTFWQIVTSVLAAAIGVQSDKNRQRDFTSGNPVVFIVGGLTFTVLFVVALISIVMLVLP